MTRNRSARALASLGLITTLALTALAGPGAVLGARAQADFSATPVLPAVSPGAAIAYDVFFDNIDSSNISQLNMRVTTPNGGTLLAIESTNRPGACATVGETITCSFGALTPDATPIEMRIVYTTPTSGTSFDPHFLFSATGVSPDKKKNSHGDDYDAHTAIALDDDSDFAAGYVLNSALPVADVQTLSRRNPQATKVNPPAANIPVAVGEEDATAACPGAAAASCFGQLSFLNVDDGASFPGGFSVLISYNVNKPNANFVHFFDDGVTYELITQTCNSTTAPTNLPCKLINTSQGNTFATIWLTQNGRIQGW
jgi:hypothetical protein